MGLPTATERRWKYKATTSTYDRRRMHLVIFVVVVERGEAQKIDDLTIKRLVLRHFGDIFC